MKNLVQGNHLSSFQRLWSDPRGWPDVWLRRRRRDSSHGGGGGGGKGREEEEEEEENNQIPPGETPKSGLETLKV